MHTKRRVIQMAKYRVWWVLSVMCLVLAHRVQSQPIEPVDESASAFHVTPPASSSAVPSILSQLQPFLTDGCSAFPDGTLLQQQLWLDCCIDHDIAYWLGGSYGERVSADRQLQQCVTRIGEPAIAELMLAGVRVGGSPYWPTSFRWGYGWPYWDGDRPRGYRKLSDYLRQSALLELRDIKRVTE